MKKFFLSLALLISSIGFSQEKSPEVIILLGAPASGKGTQAKFIVKELGIPHISTGDLFRDNIKNNTPLGIEAKKYIDNGQLVPDEVVLNMLFVRISQSDAKKGYLLDGFPRTVPQAEAYAKHVGKNIKPIVINIDVPNSVLMERVAERQKTEGRSDDTQEIAQKRLKIYEEQTAPLIAYYSAQGNFFKIEGNAPVEQVQKQILSIIKK